MEEMSDVQLIELFRTENDQGALHALISRYSTRAYTFAFRLVRDQAEAEDITQEAFIKAWKHIHRFNPEQHFSTWLLTIVYRTALDYLRKRRATPFSLFNSEDTDGAYEDTIVDTDPLPDALAELRERKDTLEKALSDIDEQDRFIILLHHSEELGFEEIAMVMDKPMNTVKSRYRRALMRLRGALSKDAPK